MEVMEIFRKHMTEELEGSMAYIHMAIELKPMGLEWSKKFYEMSSAELANATALKAMLSEFYSKASQTFSKMPDYILEGYNYLMEHYNTMSEEIKSLHRAYA